MGFSNGLLYSKSEKSQKGDKGDKEQGFRLTADEHFHLENKRLTNLAPPVDNNDAVTKKHLKDALKVGSCVLKASVDRVSVDTIGRYADRQSADISTDTRPICRPRLGRHINRRQRTCMSADTRPILHCHSADSWPVHYRHSADHVLLYRPSIGRYYRSVCRYLDRYSADMSAETRPTYRPTSTDTHVS